MKTLLATIATITLTTHVATADLITFEDPSEYDPNSKDITDDPDFLKEETQ